jgi:hypothetical protein
MENVVLNYKDMRSDGFRNAMVKVATCTRYNDAKVSYRVMKLTKAIEEKLIASQKEWIELGRKYIARGEDGNFLVANGEFVLLENVNQELAKQEIQSFSDKKAETDRWKLALEDLTAAQLSPADLAVLEPIYTVSDEIKALN